MQGKMSGSRRRRGEGKDHWYSGVEGSSKRTHKSIQISKRFKKQKRVEPLCYTNMVAVPVLGETNNPPASLAACIFHLHSFWNAIPKPFTVRHLLIFSSHSVRSLCSPMCEAYSKS